MKNGYNNTNGVSEAVSVILVIILIIGLAFAIYAMVFGSVDPYLTKTSRVAASAGTANVPLDSSSSMQIMRVLPMSGEKYYINGQNSIPLNTANTVIAFFTVLDPQGQSYTVTPGYLSSTANTYGTPLFIYKDQSANYRLTDSLNSISSAAQLRPFALGDYQITMRDNSANVPLTVMKVRITGNGTGSGSQFSLPVLNTLPNATSMLHGGITNYTDASGLKMYTFDGSTGYMSATSNPALAFTGELSLSLWMNPTTTGPSTNSANWHTIIGKGQLNGVNSENDNYQLMQLGNQLLFEWNDASPPYTHYQAITSTPTGVLQANTMQYVTVKVSNGALAVQVNGGTSLPLTYNTGNVPKAAGTILTTVPTVRLQNNANDLLTGKQNAPAGDTTNTFYYKGDMSEVALYNRALTADEIAHNLNYKQI